MSFTRRVFLTAAGASACGAGFLPAAAAPPKTRMGIATTSYMTVRKFKDTLEFVEHCGRLGAAGAQSALTSFEPEYLKQVRSLADRYGMYLEVMCPLPKADMGAFVRTMNAAKAVGALCARSACLSGRRYETFSSLDDWKSFVNESKASIARAVPVADKLALPFAIENHKDWTVDEMAPLLKSYSSENFGVCLDLGNNIALLDDPMEVVERLAPYALSTHLKDMAVSESPDGFLLSEVVLGTGILDIQGMVSLISKARPKTRFTLEMITRNPLSVPCLTEKYWKTFPERNGIHLARTLRWVKQKKSKLPTLDGLKPDAQLRIEEENVKRCLAYAV